MASPRRLCAAAREGDAIACTKLLQEGLTRQQGDYPGGHPQLVDRQDEEGRTALFYCATADVVRVLLAAKADVAHCDERNRQCLTN